MIDGVKIKELKLHKDERGRLLEILRCNDDFFEKFGQIYVTTVYPGHAKGWHYHKKQTDNFTCLKGKVKIVLYDARKDSKTKGEINEFIMTFEQPQMIRIPLGVYHGFETACDEESMILNVPTMPYNHEDPDEHRVPFNSPEVPYKWNSKKGG